jgi:tripartite-type tricarboxylate transporter receptor subunit TctC
MKGLRSRVPGTARPFEFLLLFLFAICAPVWAQTYPSKPLRLVVPFPPGGGTDIVARVLGAKLTEAWGQPVVIEHRPGASATLGPDLVSKSVPDGYTLVLVTSTFTMTPALQKVPYDPVRDFAPITLFAAVPNILMVHPSLPARTLADIAKLARGRPGELTYGSSGNGSVPHLATEMLRMSLPRLDIVHVPYKGNAQSLTALLSGEISMTITSLPSALPYMKSGRLRAVAVTTKQRSQAAPQVPTLAESGAAGYDFASEWGLLFPAKVSGEIVARLHGELQRALRTADVTEKLASQGAEIVASTPEEYAASLRAGLAKWQSVVRAANIKPN